MFNKCCEKEDCDCGCKKTPKLINLALVVLSVFLISQALIGFQKLPSVGDEVYPQSTIAVSGSGEAYAVPDIATFSFSVTETALTVKTAQEKVDTKISEALAVVRGAGVEDKDIKTANYSVYPKYEWLDAVCSKPENIIAAAGGNMSAMARSDVSYCPPGKQVLNGYEVTQSIIVKVRDTEKAGELVTNVGASGVSNISGLEFSVDKRDDYVAKAREDAIKEAKAKAKELAKQLGVRLGKIVYYSENGNYPVYDAMGKGGGEMMTVSAAPRAAELPTGETKITSDVSITYEIK
jgi:uncharacterized protein